jgi:ribosome-binding factor A
MPKEFSRTQRVADFLKQEISQIIQREVRDPRVGMTSVTDVEVARDLSYAKVFVTILGVNNETEAKPAIDVLNHASGFLRTQISKVMSARTTPKLRFVFDKSITRGAQMSKLIDDVVAQDREHARQRGDEPESSGKDFGTDSSKDSSTDSSAAE